MILPHLEDELVSTVERLRPALVQILRTSHPSPRRAPGESQSSGSGIVLDRDGYVATNDHVVRGASHLTVTLDDGRSFAGQEVGRDPATDLAVVRVPAHDLPAVELADSDHLRVGQFVVALGNSLGLPGGPSASFGVISALGRPLPGSDYVLEGLVQTDAAINPGNSGGPLADRHGAVVGLNTAMIPFAQGVGFAVPSNTVRRVAEQLRRTGHVVRPWLGISGYSYPTGTTDGGTPKTSGVLITQVFAPSPARVAGLRPGDLLVRLGPRRLAGLRDLLSTLGSLPIGGAVDFEFVRQGTIRRSVLRIAEAPTVLPAS
ncbi:MAG TPA: trypsin-like peptidase domain-containing protein [Thermoplasmata archaeon]|nr:trypsin-like peptidase domain-containing protein [Thermoplasmata archaeon]